MIYKVGILGATGRMGSELTSLLFDHYPLKGDYFELSEVVSGHGKWTSIESIPLKTLDADLDSVHVWIDFSNPAATLKLLSKIKGPIVIGTTGFSDAQLLEVENYSKKSPVLMASNFSPGIQVLEKTLKNLTLPENYDVVLHETHHKDKKDAPSGTAKTLIKTLKQAGFQNVQVEVTRAGGEKGIHEIRFVSNDEELVFYHRVINRKVFAKGALQAAWYLLQKKVPKMYSLSELE